MFSRSRPITLQRLLVLALLLVVVPMVAVQAWFYYLTAQRSAVQFQEQLASEVSARVYDKVLQFFDVPQRVVRFNAEQFRAGVLNPADSEGMQRNFLLQLRQQWARRRANTSRPAARCRARTGLCACCRRRRWMAGRWACTG
jgi:hypothetical protein